MTPLSSTAERAWIAIAPDGAEHDLILKVSLATQSADADWTVNVSLAGLEPGTYTIFGIDSWQAISLGMRFALTRISHFIAEGWQFYWERGGEQISSADLFENV